MNKQSHTKYLGLSAEEVANSRSKNGTNLIQPPPRQSAWLLLMEKFKDPVILILIVAALISIFTGATIESLGILLAIALATGIAFFNEYRAGKEFDLLNQVEESTPIKTIRDGEFELIPKQDLVVGDIIFLETGEEIPADAQVLESVNFHVDQSKFTGEPEPILKTPQADPSVESSYPQNLLLRGSMVLEGSAFVRIVTVGSATELGKTAIAAAEITDTVTPLQKQLNRLGKVIALVGSSLAMALLAILIVRALLNGQLPTIPAEYMNWQIFGKLLGFFMIAVTLIVVAVPEGLAMSVTLSLAYSMRRMAASQCLVRKLHACETIGAATVICTDKTGTLTMNQMRVQDFFGECSFQGKHADLLREALSVNSTANLGHDGDRLTVAGNPTEGALLIYLEALGSSYRDVRDGFKVAAQFPFTTERKMMATAGSTEADAQLRIHVKGAPEIVLRTTTGLLTENGVEPMTESLRKKLLDDFAAKQATGCRTIAFACGTPAEVPSNFDTSRFGELLFLGFVSISDPVRPEVPDAVQSCRNAGIDVKIVTGDTPATAGEIGRQIGLWPSTGQIGRQMIEGRDFDALDEAQTLERVKTLHLIARARPNDKMKLVKALQANGEVVAVTGDGTNDAPALNYADVGIAMGKTGTAVAREAADIILLDDSFRSIANAVLWGRSLYLNIQKFILFQLTINVAAVGIALIGPFLGLELPLTVIQMLWINLIMDTFAALALATERPNPEVMTVPPRSPDAFIVTGAMASRILLTALFYILCFVVFVKHFDVSEPRTLTLWFTGFVLLQFWNLLNAKCFGSHRSLFVQLHENPTFWLIAVGIVAGQYLIVQYCGVFFRTVPLSPADWGILLATSSVIFWLGEAARLITRVRSRKAHESR